MKIFYRAQSSDLAGGQRVLLDILTEARRAGHDVVVSSPGPGRLTGILETSGVPLHFISLKKTFYFHHAVSLAAYLRKAEIDLVHIHDMVAGNVLTRFASALAGVPCLSHIHIENAFHSNPWIRKYQTALDNLSSRICRKIIAVSEPTKKSLVRQGINADKIEIVRNGVEAPSPPPAKSRADVLRELNLPAHAILIGCVARLCRIKGQEDLLRAAARFAHRPDVFFVFVGEDLEQNGAYEKKLKQLAHSAGISPQVRFAGYQSDVNSFMHAFAALVLPSWKEGLPLALLEAMACAKPVIAASVDGSVDLVQDGNTGFLIQPGNPDQLADRINTILTDPGRAEEMGRRGLLHVQENFSKSRMLERILEIYEEAAHQFSSPESSPLSYLSSGRETGHGADWH